MRIGVDVGGTNTDAVLMDGSRVVAFSKFPTTPDISSGIIQAVHHLLEDAVGSPDRITAVMIGTTHFTNAFVEGKGLLEVGALRIGLPAGRALPPMVDWPDKLRRTVGSHVFQVHGGYHYDGRENRPLNEAEVADAARQMRSKGLRAVAIAGIFSQVNAAQEERAADIVRNELPDAAITISSRIGRIGMLERENATIINASLAELSRNVVRSFRQSLETLNIGAPFYLSQNDGTLMNADFAEEHPVLTFASGPTNSMRGAAYLSGIKEGVVADIGGTTTDVGVLAHGFPRESSTTANIGGVRTNFRMPDVLSVGLGGGSYVRSGEQVTVGPDSVGFRLLEQGVVFGGDVLTASDIAVAGGPAKMGNPERIRHLEPSLIERGLDAIHRKLEEAVDRMKTSADEVPLVLVGGGAVLISRPVAGTSDVIVPENADVANAIGAAIAQVGGEVDRVFAYDEVGRDAAIKTATAEAVAMAIGAGALRDTVGTVDVEEVHLQYIPGGVVRLRVRVVGDLGME